MSSRNLAMRWLALSDLLGRYGAVLRQAWQDRQQHDARPRLPHEAQFLPAALALQETPVSPAPRVAMWLLISFALIGVAWATLGRMDVVATIQGRIVPDDRSKVVQPLETATVQAIRVTDGQQVQAGEVLIELDATSTAADSQRTASDLAAARLQAARAQALLQALASGKPPSLDRVASAPAERWAQEQRLLDGQYGEYQARLASIDANIARRSAELASTREIVGKLAQTAPMARQQAQDLKDLADQNFISRHGYMQKEQTRIEQEGDLATQRSRIHELEAALREGQSQRVALLAETRRVALDALGEAEQKTAALGQELIKAESRSQRMTLTAPVAGTVQQLAVHTVGGVVTPAQQLLVIVPHDNSLEVEAFIENKDIGFVHVGQEAEVKVETFPFTKYGTLPARLSQVSHDAINDDKRGLIYSSRVKLGRATLQVEGQTVRLTPGMAVTVEVKTGSRRVIEYFLNPLLQYKDESLRER
jgi:hemolysin D